MQELNWNNEYEIRKAVKNEVAYIMETIIDEYKAETFDDAYDAMHEIIDGHEFVIYNYQARKLCGIFDKDPFGYSDLTGERNTSWNQMAFEVLQEEFNKAYDLYE
mgnify:CR=1 FL=1